MSTPLPIAREGRRSATVFPLLDCNARCPFCSTRVYTPNGIASPIDFRSNVARRAKDYTWPLDELKQRLEELRAQGVTRLNIQGGEPTVYADIVPLLEHGRALGFDEQVVVSNGRRFADRAFVERFVGAGVTTIVLSIFGPDIETHDASLGVRGAFDELLAGVRNLVALLPPGKSAAGRPTVMAQLTIHGENFRTLPEMLRFWHDAGLRDFTIRLLRETDNTRDDGDRWFFDLADLKEPLSEALDFAAAHRDVFVSFSEIAYCVLDRDRLGAVLGDLATNPNLRGAKAQVARHFERATEAATTRAPTAEGACADCDLASSCVRFEAQYGRRYSGRLRPIRVRTDLEALLAGPFERPRFDRLRHLLRHADRLAWFGGTDDDPLRLLARLVSWSHAHAPAELGDLVFSERTQVELANRLRKSGRPHTIRYVASDAPIPPDLATLKAHLTQAPADPVRAFLARTSSVGIDPLVASFAWQTRTPTGDALSLAFLHDPERLPQPALEAALAPLLREPS